MTESARLPRFVREALEGEADAHTADAQAFQLPAIDAERGLLALERALGGDALGGPGGARITSGVASNSIASKGIASKSNAPEGDTTRVEVDLAEADVSRLFQRLDGTVSKPPYRYAPFFARAAELFDLPEEDVIAQMARLADPKAWTFAGLPGISHFSVKGGPRVRTAETLFVRFKPGLYFPRHDHVGVERVLVLEGSYEDSHGVQHSPGELRDWPSGTEHSFKVGSETCIFASVVFGRRFHAWPLRMMSKLLGR